MKQIRILIVDDHPLMRDAVRSTIEDEDDMLVVAEASDGQEAFDLARALKPDVVIMDLYMPYKDGLSAIHEIIKAQPDIYILALTSAGDEENIMAVIQAGAQGYLTKDVKRKELLQAIRTVSTGESYMPSNVTARLLNGLRRKTQSHGAFDDNGQAPNPLTEREKEVLELVGQGISNADIADSLSISIGTVRTHIHHLLHKLDLESRSQLIVYAMQQRK